jgi:hypothetical protein
VGQGQVVCEKGKAGHSLHGLLYFLISLEKDRLFLWNSPNHLGEIWFLSRPTFLPNQTLQLFELLLEPFPKPRLIKPYYDHYHHKYHPRAKIIHGSSSFPPQILQSSDIHRASTSMSFFGIQMENAFAYKITMKFLLQQLL